MAKGSTLHSCPTKGRPAGTVEERTTFPPAVQFLVGANVPDSLRFGAVAEPPTLVDALATSSGGVAVGTSFLPTLHQSTGALRPLALKMPTPRSLAKRASFGAVGVVCGTVTTRLWSTSLPAAPRASTLPSSARLTSLVARIPLLAPSKPNKRGKKLLKLQAVLPEHIWHQLSVGTALEDTEDGEPAPSATKKKSIANSTRATACSTDLGLSNLLQELPKSKKSSGLGG
jgi:hypothetical protein